ISGSLTAPPERGETTERAGRKTGPFHFQLPEFGQTAAFIGLAGAAGRHGRNSWHSGHAASLRYRRYGGSF
ncbi:MAG: hypothetical protein U1E50_16055, partial [Caulobacteraceae bacterium]